MNAAQKPRTTTAAKSESVSTSADTAKGTAKGTDTPKDGLGKVAYEAYRGAVDGGDAMDEWDDVHGSDSDNGRQAAAWEAAAQAVLSATFGRK